MASVYGVIKRPLVTEKGVTKKESDRTLCFEVAADANKTEIRHAVEAVFKVKVEEVRTSITSGKLRRRGRFSGYRADWKKAWVRLKAGEKMPEYAEI
jgi:large subunit ribosomal protein L23